MGTESRQSAVLNQCVAAEVTRRISRQARTTVRLVTSAATILQRTEISNILSMGSRARSMMCFGNSILGVNLAMQSRTFSSVFIFMYLHSLQRHESLGIFMT